MPSRGEPIHIGPFKGGLNTISDPSALADDELAVCENFEVDLSGSLIARPAIEEVDIGGTSGLTIIGYGTFPGGRSFLFATKLDAVSTDNGVYAFDGNQWYNIDLDLVSTVAIQHGGFVWFPPKPGTKSTQVGGRWDPVNGFVEDANMPEGEAAVFHKSRMFIVPGPSATSNSSRLQFTDPITSSTLSWPGTNIIDVQPGDGQSLNNLVILNDNLVLFKTDSTYLLAYDTSPSDAVLRSVNPSIGSSNSYSMQVYENSIFTLHQGKLYEMVNFDYQHINIQVPFEYDAFIDATVNTVRMVPVFMSKLGDRLVIGYYNRIYVFGLKTRTWSTWTSTDYRVKNIGPIWEMPTDELSGDNPAYYTCSNLLTNDRTFKIHAKAIDAKDRFLTGSTPTDVPIISKFRTKTFDFAISHQWKKLMWWGVDMIGFNCTGTVIPYTANAFNTWNEFAAEAWSTLADNTWGQSRDTLAQTTTVAPELQIPGIRTFQKFPKTLRFRQVAFEVSISHSGSVLEGPVQVFSLTAIVASKQIVGKQVN